MGGSAGRPSRAGRPVPPPPPPPLLRPGPALICGRGRGSCRRRRLGRPALAGPPRRPSGASPGTRRPAQEAAPARPQTPRAACGDGGCARSSRRVSRPPGSRGRGSPAPGAGGETVRSPAGQQVREVALCTGSLADPSGERAAARRLQPGLGGRGSFF